MSDKKILKLCSDISLSIVSYSLYYILKVLPYKQSLVLAKMIGECIVYNLIKHRRQIGIKNIQLAFPNYSFCEAKNLYKRSCGLAVQNFAEKINISTIVKKKYYTIVDPYNMLEYINTHRALMFSAHLGNWELLTLPFLTTPNIHNIKDNLFVAYKTPKNPFINKLLNKVRSYLPCTHLDLTVSTLLTIIKAIQHNNAKFLMLVDQRVTNGLLVNLLNRPARTSTVIPMIAIKYNIPVIPIRVVRKNKFYFDIIIDNLIYPEITNDKDKDILHLTSKINNMISEWITKHPEQWYWLHTRW